MGNWITQISSSASQNDSSSGFWYKISGERMKEKAMLRGKRRSTCLRRRCLSSFLQERRLNRPLSPGWQGVGNPASPIAPCGLGADNRQNKTNLGPLWLAHRAQCDQTAQWAGNGTAPFGACSLCSFLNLSCQPSKP